MRVLLLLIIVTASTRLLCEETGQYRLVLGSAAYSIDNQDFRSYNHDHYQEQKIDQVYNSDDRSTFFIGSFLLGLEKSFAARKLSFVIGSEYLQSSADLRLNQLSLYTLACETSFGESSSFIMGRFFHELGGSRRDYLVSDTVDGLELNLVSKSIEHVMGLRLLGEVISQGAKPTGSYSMVADEDETYLDDFNGDTNSYRFGFVLEYTPIKFYSYYLRYGANRHGGAQRAQNGRSSLNQADEDFLSLSGLRIYHTDFSGLNFDTSTAVSIGRDSSPDTEHLYQGYVVLQSLSYRMEPTTGFSISEVFLDSGCFSHNFCGMRSDTPGGILLDKVLGYSMSPYAGFNGFVDYQNISWQNGGFDKSVPKLFLKGGLVVTSNNFEGSYSAMIIFANEGKADNWTMPYENKVSRMGLENQLVCAYKTTLLTTSAGGALFVPEDFYLKRLSKGSDFLYAVFLKVSCSFDL